MAKTPQQIQKELEGIKTEALRIQSVVNERGEVDVSQIEEGVEPVQLPETNLRDLSIAFSGKADDSTMSEIESRDPALVARARQFQNRGSFTSNETPVEEPQTPEDKLLAEKQTLDQEIRTLEEKMASSEQRRSDAYEEGGIFDDMRSLNALKAKKREIEDREIEIPIEGRQKLRGKQATKTEFNQLTSPAIEKNLINQLAASRETSRLADTIETNLAVIDSQLAADNERDEFLYEKKIERLNTVQTAYSNIITEQQKEAIEFQKFQYDLLRDAASADNTLRGDLIKEFAKSGKFSGTQLSDMMNMSTDELLGQQYETTSPFNWTDLSEEDAALYLDEDSYDRYQTYKTRQTEMTEVEKAKNTNLQSANNTIGLIEDMLDDKAGLKTSVGGSWLGRQDFREGLITGFGNESKQFRANFKKLVSQATLDKLLELKAAGGTLGAISEKELDILGKAALALGSIESGDGKASGKSNLKEEDFITGLETMRMASMKVYIAERIGASAYAEGNFVNMDSQNEDDFDTIEKLYQDLKKTPIGGAANYADDELKSEENLNTAFNLIRGEEGLRTEAYQDVTGKWTIGFGNTMINGRPVQPGDRLTQGQAEALMQKSVVENYTNFADNMQTEITPSQFAALTSFEYNLGSGVWQQPTGKRILALINEGRNEEAGRLMLQYNKAKNPQTGELQTNRVLAQRRMREANLLLS
jgi:lysozyme